MNDKIGRNAPCPCPCGSGKKFKTCCMNHQPSQASAASYAWMGPDGLHVVAPGGPLTSEALDTMTRTYQKRIRQSPMWKQLVQAFGKDKAEELLKACQVEPG